MRLGFLISTICGLVLVGQPTEADAKKHLKANNVTDYDDNTLPGVVMAAPGAYEQGGGDKLTWKLNCGKDRTISGTKKDPADPMASSHGGGQIKISKGGIVSMTGSTPRYYVTAPSPVFKDVEMIAYGRLTNKKAKFKDLAGMTMVTRSNHDQIDKDPCQAMGYYSRIYFNTGEFAFQKEFYHSMGQSKTIYTQSRRAKLYNGGFPVNKWIGMKFEVRTNADGKSVSLKGYVDENESGNWKLVHETTDNGGWKAMTSVPSSCKYKPDEVVLRNGMSSYFRTDDVNKFEWKKLSIRVL